MHWIIILLLSYYLENASLNENYIQLNCFMYCHCNTNWRLKKRPNWYEYDWYTPYSLMSLNGVCLPKIMWSFLLLLFLRNVILSDLWEIIHIYSTMQPSQVNSFLLVFAAFNYSSWGLHIVIILITNAMICKLKWMIKSWSFSWLLMQWSSN